MSSTLPHSAPRFLFAPCRPDAAARVPDAAGLCAAVRSHHRRPRHDTRRDGTHGDRSGRSRVDVPTRPPGGRWSLAARGIDYVDLRAEGADLGVDDLAFSSSPQPDSVVTGGPAARVDADRATFAFGANRPDIAGFAMFAGRRRLHGLRVAADADRARPGPAHVPRRRDRLLRGGRRVARPARVDRARAAARHAGAARRRAGRQRRDTSRSDIGTPGAGVAGFECSVDGGAFSRCSAPFTVGGLAPGPHTIDVRAVDADGRADPDPATARVRGAPASVGARRRRIGDRPRPRPDPGLHRDPAARQRAAGGGRADARAARLGHRLREAAVEPLAPAQAGPLAGLRPAQGHRGAAGRDDRRRAPRVSSRCRRPATAGPWAIRAAGSAAPRWPRRSSGSARRRLRRAALRARAIPTTLVLASAPEAERGCRALRPGKGIVRSLTARAKGLFRVTRRRQPGAGHQRHVAHHRLLLRHRHARHTRARSRLRQGAPAHRDRARRASLPRTRPPVPGAQGPQAVDAPSGCNT